MGAAEGLDGFASGAGATLLGIGQALADGFHYVGAGGDIEKALVGFGVLNDGFGFSVNREDHGLFGLLEELDEFCGIAPEGGHGVNVFFDVEHGWLPSSS